MGGVPQRGRRADAPVNRISIPIDAELKHALKRAVLDARSPSITTYVTGLIEEDPSNPPRAAESPGTAQAGRGARLDMFIDPELHRRLKSAALDADLTVTEYLAHLIEQAVSAAQGACRGRG
ncbi:MAG: hypothetical protein M3R38_04400 [Actinomycetota bacterium]|nr:hypothetical protein [Actinomycetota bacterium]MDP9484317.1 hypothetical protein [Actinomycetota bacterium]